MKDIFAGYRILGVAVILLFFWYVKDATPMRCLLIYTISNEKFDVIFVPLDIKYLFPPLADFLFSNRF